MDIARAQGNRKLLDEAAQNVSWVLTSALITIAIEVCQCLVTWIVQDVVNESGNELGFASTG